MTRSKYTLDGAVLVAIDIAKSRHEVLIERPGVKRRHRLTVLNNKAEIERLVTQLKSLNQPVIAGFDVRLISSVASARTREALHNGWDKNDPKDAQVILHMLRIDAVMDYVDPFWAKTNDLQELSKTHEMVSKAKTQTWHRILTHYLPLYFPEIERFAGNSRSDWFLALLERFPTPGSIIKLGEEAFTREAWNLVGRKVSKARLIHDIYCTARDSVAPPIDEDSAAITMFRMVVAEARSLICQRNLIETLADEKLSLSIDYQLLRTIPGIGPINALTILAEAGDLRRFSHHRQFLKFCGLDLATHQSGMFRGQSKLSKFGKPTGWISEASVILREMAR
jgi:transposase